MNNIDRLVALFESGKYSADKEGNVYSHTDTSGFVRNKNKILKPYITPGGYMQVDLYDEKGSIKKRVHQVVWTFFNRTFDTSKVINHIDFDPRNNKLSNLELVTQAENLTHSNDRRLKKVSRGQRHHWAKLTENQVKDIKLRLKSGQTTREISQFYGVYIKTVYLIGKGLRWKHV